MRDSSTKHDLLAWIITLLLFCGTAACAEEVTIGNSKIVIPEQEGFERISGQVGSSHPLAARFAETCDEQRCAIYVGRETGEPDTWAAIAQFYQIRFLYDNFTFDNEEFQLERQSMTKGLEDGVKRKLELMIPTTNYQHIEAPDFDEELIFEGATTEFLDYFHGNDSQLSLSALAHNKYIDKDGSRITHLLSVTYGFVHARDKILTILVVAQEADMAWTQSFFISLAEDIVRENR